MGTDAPSLPEEYLALAARLDRASGDLAKLRATATSSDGCVTAVVGATGELTDLLIDHTRSAELEPEALVRRVLEAAQRASAQVRERRYELVDSLLPEHLRRVVRGAAERGR
jgi:DNA-binding protein YbaB